MKPDRSRCLSSPCTCHDDGCWTPGKYPRGCSSCGCRWPAGSTLESRARAAARASLKRRAALDAWDEERREEFRRDAEGCDEPRRYRDPDPDKWADLYNEASMGRSR